MVVEVGCGGWLWMVVVERRMRMSDNEWLVLVEGW